MASAKIPGIQEISRQGAALIVGQMGEQSLMRPGKKPRALFEQDVARGIRKSKRKGFEPACLWNGTKLRAIVSVAKGFSERIGVKKLETLWIGLKSGDASAERWLVAHLKDYFAAKPDFCFQLNVSIKNSGLRRKLERLGMEADSVMLLGSTEIALKSLQIHLNSKSSSPLEKRGLRIRDIETSKDVRQIVRLGHRVFREDPAPCWFCAQTNFMRGVEADLLKLVELSPSARAKRARVCLVVDRQDRIL
ncbi:MAG: hypothetical protein ABIR96_02690, partial [Bdellovibrionota bacterium]